MRRLLVLGLATALTTALLAPAATATTADDVEVVTALTELVEGVTVDKQGSVFVSVNLSGELLKFAPGSSEPEVFGSIPGWTESEVPLGAGFLGLTVDDKGNVYGAAQWAGSTGVWKFNRNTGKARFIPGTEVMSFPNSLIFDRRGNLYVTDSNSTGVINPLDGQIAQGAVYRIKPNGRVDKWVEDPALGGNGQAGLFTPVGANGIAINKRTLYVANSEGASILTIPILKDGSPGLLSPLPADWPLLTGFPGVPPDVALPAIPDGIAFDRNGAIYVAVVAQSAIMRINTDGTVDVLAHDTDREVLDFPSSVAFGTIKGDRKTLYIVNLAAGPPGGAGPALMTLDVGVPGKKVP